MIKKAIIFGIKQYQIHLSPKKGYRCAYSVLNNTCGCSGAIIDIFNNNSLYNAFKLTRQRFKDCENAFKELKRQKAFKIKSAQYINDDDYDYDGENDKDSKNQDSLCLGGCDSGAICCSLFLAS